MTGYVTTRSAAPGLFIQPGVAPPPFTVADLSTMWMFANVPESGAPDLRVGQKSRRASRPIPIAISTEKSWLAFRRSKYAAHVRAIGNRHPEHLLRAGMFANFTITVGSAVNAIAVPQSAVVREGDGSMSVWTTKNGRHFVRRTVKIGQIQNDLDQIVEELQKDEQIVTEGAVFLSNKLAGGTPD